MSMNVSEFVWARVQEWGLNRVYGYPGDGVGGLDEALEKAKGTLHYVQVRHEEMAAFMASAHAKFTGQVGLCYATSGPGAIHLLNGLYDAKMDHVPVVAIIGQQARTAIGSSYQQEVDLQTLFKDVASNYIAHRHGAEPDPCAHSLLCFYHALPSPHSSLSHQLRSMPRPNQCRQLRVTSEGGMATSRD